tara:strand:- start:3545 stop:3751 length:207 start_codon:yes stop_codon:yes gene_type:complete
MKTTSKISEQVQVELAAAQTHMRQALAFAARSESPFLIKHVSEMVFNIEHIQELDDILNTVKLDEIQI